MLGPGCVIQVVMAVAPWIHISKGGMVCSASSRSSPISAFMS